jgi:hypothetical protein
MRLGASSSRFHCAKATLKREVRVSPVELVLLLKSLLLSLRQQQPILPALGAYIAFDAGELE